MVYYNNDNDMNIKSDLCSNEEFLSSSGNKAWKKFMPVQNLNLL